MGRKPGRFRVAFSTWSVLGSFGVGGPGARLFRTLAEAFPPSCAFARGADGPVPPGGTVRVLRRPVWRRFLAGTRLHRLQERGQAEERMAFDAAVARLLPPCDLALLENSTALRTMRRARVGGARVLLKYNNHPFRLLGADLEAEVRTWGGPPSFVSDEVAHRTEVETREADLVFAMSDLVLRGLASTGVPRERLRRARYGVDAERFSPPPELPSGFTVAYVGWLALYKGFPYLVEGFRDAAIPGSTLLLHGGTGIPHYHDLVERLRGGADVRIVRGPVEETYARSAVTVLPSVSDAFGNVVLESMACGVPVVVTDRCGAAEEVRDGVDGFVIPARDPGAIRDRLLRLHGDPDLRARMGKAAREAALARPWSRFHDDVRALVRECLGES